MTRDLDRIAKANPVFALPAARAALETLDPAQLEALRGVLVAIQAEAEALAEKSWKTGKGPMAAYWKAVGVYAGHIGRASRAIIRLASSTHNA